MILLPAIDIKDGNCVRLYQGDFSTVQKVAADPLETALRFQEAGAEWLHMVDLDGAKDDSLSNRDTFLRVAKNTHLKIELGGGIRSMDAIEFYLSHGIARVILGSAAVKNPELVQTAVKEYADHIAVGIDAKNEMVATHGWLCTSDMHYLTLAKNMEALGVQTLIYTDISKDGTLTGPNLEQLAAINSAVSCGIIASGGIACIQDIQALTQLGLYGTICGKSLYQGTLDLTAALAVSRKGGNPC